MNELLVLLEGELLVGDLLLLVSELVDVEFQARTTNKQAGLRAQCNVLQHLYAAAGS